MAFVQTKTNIRMAANGRIYEEGTWVANGGTSSGSLAPSTPSASDEYPAKVGAIETFSISSDTTDVVSEENQIANLRIAFTANDTGTYKLYGFAR